MWTWKIWAKLFKIRKLWRGPFKLRFILHTEHFARGRVAWRARSLFLFSLRDMSLYGMLIVLLFYLRWREGTVSESSVQHNDLSLQYKALTMWAICIDARVKKLFLGRICQRTPHWIELVLFSFTQILSSVKIKVENIAEQVDGLDKLLRRARKNLILREEKSRVSIQSVVADVQQPQKIAKHSEPRSPTAAHKLVKQKTDSSLLGNVRLLQDGPPPKSFGRGGALLRKQSLDAPMSPKLGKASQERRVSNASASTSSSLSLSASWESLDSLSPKFGSTADVSTENFPKPGTIQKLASPQNSPRKSLSKNTFKRKNPKTTKNAIYCIVVLEEWLKELAAISQEHALLLGAGDEWHSATL